MAIGIKNNTGRHLKNVILVLEDQPNSALIVNDPDLDKGDTAAGTANFDGSGSYVISFWDDHGDRWVQGDVTLVGDDLILTYSNGIFTLGNSRGDLAVVDKADLDHVAIWLTSSKIGDVHSSSATLGIEFSPFQPTVTFDSHTTEKTFWFVAVPSADDTWGLQLNKATFRFKSGEGWNENTVNNLLNSENQSQSGNAAQTIAYTIPNQLFAMFATNPNELTLEYTIQVSIDPEVLMGSE